MAEAIVLIVFIVAGVVLLLSGIFFGVLFLQTDDRVCPICGKTFDEKEQLVHHLRWSKTCGGNGRLEEKCRMD